MRPKTLPFTTKHSGAMMMLNNLVNLSLSTARQVQDSAYSRRNECHILSSLQRHRNHSVLVAGVPLGNTACRQSFDGRHRRGYPGVLGELAKRRRLRLPGRLSAGRPGDAADRRGGRLLRRVPRRDAGVEEAAPARDRQWSWIDCQLGDEGLTVVVALERRLVSEPQQYVDHVVWSPVVLRRGTLTTSSGVLWYFDHVVWSTVFSQQPSDGQL